MYPLLLKEHMIIFLFEIWLLLPVNSGSLKRIDYPKQICLAHPRSFECFHCSYIFFETNPTKFMSIQFAAQTRLPVYMKLIFELVMRKPTFSICENKDADQLCGSRTADQRLCFRYTDSTIPLLPKYEFSSI